MNLIIRNPFPHAVEFFARLPSEDRIVHSTVLAPTEATEVELSDDTPEFELNFRQLTITGELHLKHL
jgi:hypothetical protein